MKKPDQLTLLQEYFYMYWYSKIVVINDYYSNKKH